LDKGTKLKQEDYQFFQRNGYLSLGRILTDEELDFIFISMIRIALRNKIFGLIALITKQLITMFWSARPSSIA